MTEYIDLINRKLKESLPSGEYREQVLLDAMDYSLSLPGKRVRPCLTLAFCELCGGEAEKALPFACAVEMIHTYSLIHDDLPCMDNDDFRRGKPSNHKVYGEDFALLAGDALQSAAYGLMLCDDTVNAVGAERAARAAYVLSQKSGTLGMVGGQVIDLQSEGQSVGIDVLREMDEKKTAALIEAACMMGCIAAGASEEQIKAAEQYAYYIGVAFQIVDDILDVTSTTEELGKAVGSDKLNEKSTYVSLLGIDKCRELAQEYTDKAIAALSAFDENTAKLKDFAYKLRDRKK
ncbi:MAG: polyprenyl synthetase family protein [Ruminococcus sp.]|nr:polyprenyl synthetase family protein [Ruminococcus sp.]